MKKIEVQYVDESMLESRRLADALVLGAGRRRDENDAISTDKEHFALTFNHSNSLRPTFVVDINNVDGLLHITQDQVHVSIVCMQCATQFTVAPQLDVDTF